MKHYILEITTCIIYTVYYTDISVKYAGMCVQECVLLLNIIIIIFSTSI